MDFAIVSFKRLSYFAKDIKHHASVNSSEWGTGLKKSYISITANIDGIDYIKIGRSGCRMWTIVSKTLFQQYAMSPTAPHVNFRTSVPYATLVLPKWSKPVFVSISIEFDMKGICLSEPHKCYLIHLVYIMNKAHKPPGLPFLWIIGIYHSWKLIKCV